MYTEIKIFLVFQDVMILDQSGFFGMVDIQDRHRDMRLDVDNMSYEVSTGNITTFSHP